MDIETDELIPMEDSTIAAILNDIDKHLPKVPKKKLTKAEIATKANLNVPNEFKDKYWIFFTSIKKQSVRTNTT